MFRQKFTTSFTRALLLKPSSKPFLKRFILGASGAVILATSLKTIHADTQPSKDKDNNGDGALELKSVGLILDDIRKDINELQTDEQLVLNALTAHAASFIPEDTDSGIARFDSVVVPSNSPSEDHIASTFCRLPTHSWSIFGVFDGHNGPATSSFLNNNLLNAVIGALADLFSKYAPVPTEHTELGLAGSGRPEPPAEEIDKTIKETFQRVDDEIVNWAVERALKGTSKEAAVNLLATANAGSCALVGFYESDTRLFRVAVTGDSRAVLGRKVVGKDGKKGKETYEVHVLSQDQNAHNKSEEERMSALHPGEKIMDNGRVLGWGMSRAFGDATYKWSREIQERLHEEFLGDRLRPNVKTPPYFTAEPEITTTEVQPGDFVVLASDGLWDCLTNEEVVGLVGVWLTGRKLSSVTSAPGSLTTGARSQTSSTENPKVWEREELPVNLKEDGTVMYRWWRAKKRFINVDDNVAVHLARNALGGADKDLTAALLYMEPPRSRRFRDDIGVQVVLFQ